MTWQNYLLKGYEQTKLLRYDELNACGERLINFRDLKNTYVPGVLKACFYEGGQMKQLYSADDTHACVVAATGLGKTTSFVVNQIISFALQSKKRSMVITDPKGELYSKLAALLSDNGYDVRLYNFRDYNHSERWNPLVKIFRKFQKAYDLYKNVIVVRTDDGVYNSFEGIVYRDQRLLDRILHMRKNAMLTDVGNDIDELTAIIVPVRTQKDPTWEESAREVLRGLLWGLLEDSVEDIPEGDEFSRTSRFRVTEDNFSLHNALSIFDSFEDSGTTLGFDDKGFFSSRSDNSKAKTYVNSLILNNAPVTRRGIISVFNAAVAPFRESSARMLTCANSVELSSFAEKPSAVFINFKDEVPAHYQLIRMFVQDMYATLTEGANKNDNGRLKIPFYFIMDEFGNFPEIENFKISISVSRGRNIFFVLIIQSYAQLISVYGEAVSKIILDNLNVHIFFGSNNPETLKAFSEECGKITRISPLTALNGQGTELSNYHMESLPLMPVSALEELKPGECVVREVRSGYTLLSRMERYFECPEYSGLKVSKPENYSGDIDPFDKKYYMPCNGTIDF